MELNYSRQDRSTIWNEEDGVAYITFPKLTEAGVKHGFSTRLGGVSKDYLGSMNLSFHRGDDPELVMENHRRFARAIGYDETKLVFSDQVHTTKIHKITEADCGKGITRESDIKGIDGLVTDVPGIPLITFYADCVPLFFYDPEHKVIAMAHSGWRGTVARIGQVMLEFMAKEYGTNPKEVICAIGPSICQACYEVSEDVAQEFQAEFTKEQAEQMLLNKGNGKYQLDLWKANEYIMLEAGIQKEHLDITNVCTCCNHEILFSHRASQGKRGNLAGVMVL